MSDDLLTPRSIAKIVLTAVLVVAALYVVYLLRRPIGYVVLASFIAITLSAPVNVLARRMRRGFAIALVYLGVVVAAPALLALIVVPPIVEQATNLADKAPQYANDVEKYVNDNKTLRKLDDKYDLTGKVNEEAARLPGRVGDAASLLTDIGVGLINSVFALVNVLILSVFLVASGRGWVDRFIVWRRPQDSDRLKSLADRVGRTFGNYIAGAIVQALIAGVIAYAAMSIIGIPFAAPLAVLTFFADLIPLIGATIAGAVVAVITLFADFPTATIAWVIFAIVYQQVENSLIQPQIQKRAVEVHPFAVLVGVLCGATLFGVLGALLAIPVIASGQIVLREWFVYQEERHVSEQPLPGGAILLSDAEGGGDASGA